MAGTTNWDLTRDSMNCVSPRQNLRRYLGTMSIKNLCVPREGEIVTKNYAGFRSTHNFSSLITSMCQIYRFNISASGQNIRLCNALFLSQ